MALTRGDINFMSETNEKRARTRVSEAWTSKVAAVNGNVSSGSRVRGGADTRGRERVDQRRCAAERTTKRYLNGLRVDE